MKSGALQGAVVIDYPFSHRFESIHIVYDGVNGQLPNLDLINTVVSIAGSQMGIGVCLQNMWQHSDNYKHRLKTMLRGMLNQGLGHASGPHSSFIPYHIDAITLQPFGNGWQDEMAIGRVIESTFRSLNNLLEHLHQSFFLYLLMQANRFVSIGTYLPSAMLIALSFTIMAVSLWVKSGSLDSNTNITVPYSDKSDNQDLVLEHVTRTHVSDEVVTVRERNLALPLTVVVSIQFLGILPLYIFNKAPKNVSKWCKSILLTATLIFLGSLYPILLLRHLQYGLSSTCFDSTYSLFFSFHPTISIDKVIFSPSSWTFPLFIIYIELLACLLRWNSLSPSCLYSTYP